MAEKNDLMEKVVSLCKRRGFVFPGSEIYGGLANTWDYGPYGAELKKNVKNAWWKHFVDDRDDMDHEERMIAEVLGDVFSGLDKMLGEA